MSESIAAWQKLARERGWTISRTANNHIIWDSPDGKRVITSNPRSRGHDRSLIRIKDDLRKAGLFDEPKKRG